jgi:predicted MFS family arabinose efflux permease
MRVSLGILGAAAFMVIADMRVIDPLLHIIAEEFGASVGSAAVIVTAYNIPYGLFQLVYGPLGDRIGKLKVMTAAMILFALGTAACALVSSLTMLTLLRFLTGIAAAGIIPLSLAYIGDNFPYAERQTAIGHYLSAIVLGQILSGSLGGIFGEYLSWRDIFLLFGVVSIGIAVALWRASRLVPDGGRTQGKLGLAAFKPYQQLMSKPATRLVIMAVFIEGFFFFGGFAYIGAFLRDQYSLSYVAIGLMLSAFGLGGLIYSRSVRWLVHRFGESGLIRLGGWLICACYLSIAVFQNWLLFIAFNILMGLGFYMLHSTLQTKATELAPEARGTAVSLFVFSLFLGQGIGVAALGVVVDGPGYALSFVLSGVAVALLAAWLVNRGRHLSDA